MGGRKIAKKILQMSLFRDQSATTFSRIIRGQEGRGKDLPSCERHVGGGNAVSVSLDGDS